MTDVRLPFWQRCILWILNPLFLVSRLLITAYLRIVQDKKITGREKCPGCGARKKHTIRYAPAYSGIIHLCVICQAAWWQSPIVDVDRWQVIVLGQQERKE